MYDITTRLLKGLCQRLNGSAHGNTRCRLDRVRGYILPGSCRVLSLVSRRGLRGSSMPELRYGLGRRGPRTPDPCGNSAVVDDKTALVRVHLSTDTVRNH